MDLDEYWQRCTSLLTRSYFVIKLFELTLAIASTALIQDSIVYGSTPYMAQFVCMVYPGFILITLVNILGMVISDIPKVLVMLWAIIGGILWLIAGIILIESYYYIDSIFFPGTLRQLGSSSYEVITNKLAAGVLGVTNGIVHLIELALLLKAEEE